MKNARIKITPKSIAYADNKINRLILEFNIPGAPSDTIDMNILKDSIWLKAPAGDIEYVFILVLRRPVKPDIAKATYENGLLRIEVPFKDPMEDAVKVAIKTGKAETKTRKIAAR